MVLSHTVLLTVAVVLFATAHNSSARSVDLPPVVGGQVAVPHSAPWIVSLQLNNRHRCGASLIKPDWILTAAHCIIGLTPAHGLEVVAGKHNLNVAELQEERRRADRLISHENYPGGVAPFDIGLIHVSTPFALTSSVRLIPLPAREAITSGNVRLFGWGSTSTGIFPSFPNLLQTVTKPTVDFETCRAIHGGRLHPTNLCTGPISGGISACSGDSGGPLDHNGVLVGVVSWGGIPCGRPNSPSVYVRVSAFIDWINQNSARLADEPNFDEESTL